MRSREQRITGGGYYASGKLDMIRNSGDSRHLFNTNSHTNRSDAGGVYTAIRGSVTNANAPENLITNQYLGNGAGYQTAFKGFVQGITEDQHGLDASGDTVLGSVYDINIELWAAPWVLTDHLDHPSVLKAMPHYMAVEDANPIPSILGSVRVITVSYPVFLEIKYTDNGDGTDSFTYTILDTAYTPVVEGAVVILTYPFPVKTETSIISNDEAGVSDD